LAHFLPYNAKQWFYNNEQWFYIVFLVIWLTGISVYILQPMINAVMSGMYWIINGIFGLFR